MTDSTQRPLRVTASIGTEGSVFLSPQVWLSHLKDEERIAAPKLHDLAATPEFATAVRDLQRQHRDMLDFLHEHALDVHVGECGDGCMGCGYDELTDRWEANRG